MKNFLKICLSLVLLVLFSICFEGSAITVDTKENKITASILPDIALNNLKISEQERGIIYGSFNAINNESYYLPSLNYKISLYSGTEFNSLELIDEKIHTDIFPIPPKESREQSFRYAYPKNLMSGDYTIMAQIISDRGIPLGWQMQKITLKGENKFLKIINSDIKVLSGDQIGYPQEGINVKATDEVFSYFKVKNPDNQIIVVPNIKIYSRSNNGPVLDEINGTAIVIEKNETKEVKVLLPKFEAPDSYLAEIKLTNNKEVVSAVVYARWVVEGLGGKILNVKFSKDYFKAGDPIEFDIETVGPADMSDQGNGQLDVIITDQEMNVIDSTAFEIPINSNIITSPISFKATKEMAMPIIFVTLSKAGKILDHKETSLPLFSKEAKDFQQKFDKNKQLKTALIWLGFILLALGVVLLSFVLTKKYLFKKNT